MINQEIHPYLKQYPFTYKEIEIFLFLQDQKGYEIFAPNIGTAYSMDGEIYFETWDKSSKFSKEETEFIKI